MDKKIKTDEAETLMIVSRMLPNREKVRFYIWDNLEPPLSSELIFFLEESIETYGSWKNVIRNNGNLAYKGWIYKKRKQGHWVYNYKDGKLRKDCYYRNNEYHSKCKFCNEDGSYETIEYYKGKRNGKLLRYGKNGVEYSNQTYEMGNVKN